MTDRPHPQRGQQPSPGVVSAADRRGAAAAVPAAVPEPLRVGAYDRVAGWLVTLLLLVGAAVVCLFLIWLTNRVFATRYDEIPTIPLEQGGGSLEGISEQGLQIDAPPMEELSREADLDELRVENTLAVVETAIADRLADLTDPRLTEELLSGTRGGSQGTGNAPLFGSGEGDHGGIPREQRWDLEFEETTLQAYAQQLDAFDLELAVLDLANGRLEVVSGFTQPRPRVRGATADDQRRFHFVDRKRSLRRFQDQLLRAAGIDPAGKRVYLLLTFQLEQQMAQAEMAFAGRKPEQIRQTVFRIVPQGNRYGIVVASQQPL